MKVILFLSRRNSLKKDPDASENIPQVYQDAIAPDAIAKVIAFAIE